MKDYKTVAREESVEIVERRSRFIGHVKPVQNEDEAIGFINQIRSRFRDASHNVYAYSCRENNIMRYSDDGEPAGTAGLPVLEVIKKTGINDVCIVVTRYFGGVLLGAGGLTRAYGKSAAAALESAGVVNMVYCSVFSVCTDYSLLGKLQFVISENGYKTLDSEYGTQVRLVICAPIKKEGELVDKLTDASGGRAEISRIGERYIEEKA